MTELIAVALLRKLLLAQYRHCEERFVRRSNPVFKHTGLLRLQPFDGLRAQARNDESELRNKAAIAGVT